MGFLMVCTHRFSDLVARDRACLAFQFTLLSVQRRSNHIGTHQEIYIFLMVCIKYSYENQPVFWPTLLQSVLTFHGGVLYHNSK